MVSDQEPRYRLVDANDNIVGSLYGKPDGSVAIQETASGSDREVALAPDGTFSAPSVETESLSAEKALIDNVVVQQNTIGELSESRGDRVVVDAGDYQTLFSSTEPRDVLGGVVVGQNPRDLRITWEDDSTDQIFDAGSARGLDGASNQFSALTIPKISAVKELEFRNGIGEDVQYGWRVLRT